MVQPPSWNPVPGKPPAVGPAPGSTGGPVTRPGPDGPRADSVAKVVVLSIVTLGIYMLWWAGDRGHAAKSARGIQGGLKALAGWAIAVQALTLVAVVGFYVFFFLSFAEFGEDAEACPEDVASCPTPDGFFQKAFALIGFVALLTLVGVANAILSYALLIQSANAVRDWMLAHGAKPTLEPLLMLIGLAAGVWVIVHVGIIQSDINRLRGA